jgi:peptide-methionine (R)-S-oxide reductase
MLIEAGIERERLAFRTVQMVKKLVAALVVGLAACSRPPATQSQEQEMNSPNKIQCADCETPAVDEASLPKTEEEWKKKLTPDQFYVLRRKGTEAPNSGAYLHHKEDGIYACAGCGQALYDSKTKYDACGWPSFWDALPGAVEKHSDLEATCTRCGGHLGHIFNDGPKPTGKRH